MGQKGSEIERKGSEKGDLRWLRAEKDGNELIEDTDKILLTVGKRWSSLQDLGHP